MYSQRFVFVIKNNFCISLSARSWFSLAHFGAPVHHKERKRICERPLQRNGSLNWAKNSYNRAKQQHKDSDRMKHSWKEILSRHQIIILGRLGNHDDSDNKNVTNLHIWQWQTIVLHALHVQFSFLKTFADVLVLSTRWNDLFCGCVDDVSMLWQICNLVF